MLPTRPYPLAALLLLGLACATGPKAPEPGPPLDITGSWQVRGLTTEVESGATRDIEGMLILVQTGDTYTSSFHLTTTVPTPDGPTLVEIVGHGKGTIEGTRLSGVASTQLILSSVPGEAGQFPFMPKSYGPRLLSHTTGEVGPDGSISFETDDSGVEGGEYARTQAQLVGVRVPAR